MAWSCCEDATYFGRKMWIFKLLFAPNDECFCTPNTAPRSFNHAAMSGPARGHRGSVLQGDPIETGVKQMQEMTAFHDRCLS